MTPDDLTSRAQGEAERQWNDEPMSAGARFTLDSMFCNGFVLGATWAAAQAPSVEALTAEVERLRSYKSLPEGMVWQDYYSPDDVVALRDPIEAERDALAARHDALREAAGKGLTDVEYLLRLQSGKEADYIKGAFAAHDWWRTCLRGPLADLRTALAADEAGQGEGRQG